MKKSLPLCFVLALTICVNSHAQQIVDDIVLNTTSQPPSGYAQMWGSVRGFQRFTTSSSGDLTVRRIEVDLYDAWNIVPGWNTLTIGFYHDDGAGYPSINGSPYDSRFAQFTSPISQGTQRCIAYGEVELQPNTTYWLSFFVNSPLAPSFSVGWSQPGSGSGRWLGPEDDKSALWVADNGRPNNWQAGYYPAIQVEISTVPEPSIAAITIAALGTMFLRRIK